MLPVEMSVHQQCAAEKHVCALSPPHYVTTSVGFVAAQIGVRFIRRVGLFACFLFTKTACLFMLYRRDVSFTPQQVQRCSQT